MGALRARTRPTRLRTRAPRTRRGGALDKSVGITSADKIMAVNKATAGSAKVRNEGVKTTIRSARARVMGADRAMNKGVRDYKKDATATAKSARTTGASKATAGSIRVRDESIKVTEAIAKSARATILDKATNKGAKACIRIIMQCTWVSFPLPNTERSPSWPARPITSSDSTARSGNGSRG